MWVYVQVSYFQLFLDTGMGHLFETFFLETPIFYVI